MRDQRHEIETLRALAAVDAHDIDRLHARVDRLSRLLSRVLSLLKRDQPHDAIELITREHRP